MFYSFILDDPSNDQMDAMLQASLPPRAGKGLISMQSLHVILVSAAEDS